MIRTAITWIFCGVAVIAALLATMQPVLGSFAFFRRGDPLDYETIHLVVGAIVYNAALLLVVLVFFTRVRRRWLLFAICLAQYAFLHIQLRLGLGSNQDARLLAYHIPLGVLIVLASYLIAGLAFGLRLASGERKVVDI